jgi:hypothetical protein
VIFGLLRKVRREVMRCWVEITIFSLLQDKKLMVTRKIIISHCLGVTTIKFMRYLSSTDKYDVSITTGDVPVILAYNSDTDSFTADHGPGHNTPLKINFYTGVVSLVNKFL